MITIHETESIKEPLGRVVATIGNFDGIHMGHRRIIEKVLERGQALRLKTVLITFDPHPARVIAPFYPLRLIHTKHQKTRMLETTGIDVLLFISFDRDISLLTAEEFLSQVLLSRMTPEEIYVGENFRFGRNRSADSKTLSALGEKLGFKVGIIESVIIDGETVSSSIIRRMIEDGRVERASLFLGHLFSIEGEVMPGEGIGKTIKIPTANIHPRNELLPRMGVYITESLVAGSKHRSVTNIGIRPTFNLQTYSIETHIMDFQSTIYGEEIEVFFHKRIRDELKFENLEKLREQIERDIEEMKSFFAGGRPIS
ncbi:MAG: bifunctional riboflavin kinase/FAD synthetase [Acidobacteriota bacterium]